MDPFTEPQVIHFNHSGMCQTIKVLVVIHVPDFSCQKSVGGSWSVHRWSLLARTLLGPFTGPSILYFHHRGTLSSPDLLEEAHAVLQRLLSFISQTFPVHSRSVGPGQSTIGVCLSVPGWVPSQDLSVLYFHHQGTLSSPDLLEEARDFVLGAVGNKSFRGLGIGIVGGKTSRSI
jgi:hypothetical protein